MKYLSVSALVLLIMFNDGYAPNAESLYPYSKEVIVAVPWGSSPGEIGHQPDYPTYGPESFAITPEGDIYLLDTFNCRMLVFNQEGDLKQYFTLQDSEPYTTEKVVYDCIDNTLYINRLRDNTFLVYSLDGTLLKTITCDSQVYSPFQVIDGIIAGPIGNIMDTSTENLGTAQKGAGGEDSYFIEVRQDSSLAKSIWDGVKYKHSEFRVSHDTGESKGEHGRFVIDRPGMSTKTIDLTTYYPGYFFLLRGDTPGKDIIFTGDPDRRDLRGKPTVLIKINEDLEVVSIIEDPDFIPITGYAGTYPIIIADNGDIYTLTVTAEGAKINKWLLE